jgi:hypothetical protein
VYAVGNNTATNNRGRNAIVVVEFKGGVIDCCDFNRKHTTRIKNPSFTTEVAKPKLLPIFDHPERQPERLSVNTCFCRVVESSTQVHKL